MDILQTLFFPGGTWSWFALFWFLLGALGMLVFLCLVLAPFFIWKYAKETARNTHNTMMYSKHLLEMVDTRLQAIETAQRAPAREKEHDE